LWQYLLVWYYQVSAVLPHKHLLKTANNTAVSTTTHNAQPFVFAYKVSGAFPGLDQRTFYDSLTKDLVWIDEHLITGNLNNIKVIPLNSTTENNLKKTRKNIYLQQRGLITHGSWIFLWKNCMGNFTLSK
jgi:hypothetical protein